MSEQAWHFILAAAAMIGVQIGLFAPEINALDFVVGCATLGLPRLLPPLPTWDRRLRPIGQGLVAVIPTTAACLIAFAS